MTIPTKEEWATDVAELFQSFEVVHGREVAAILEGALTLYITACSWGVRSEDVDGVEFLRGTTICKKKIESMLASLAWIKGKDEESSKKLYDEYFKLLFACFERCSRILQR